MFSLIQVFSLTDNMPGYLQNCFPGLSDDHCLMNHGPRVSFLKSWPDISPDSSARTVATVEPYMHVRQELPLLVFNAVTWDLELKHLVKTRHGIIIITGEQFIAIFQHKKIPIFQSISFINWQEAILGWVGWNQTKKPELRANILIEGFIEYTKLPLHLPLPHTQLRSVFSSFGDHKD